jgi:fructose-1,6-bisphosphatase/inositol monophosphatase family enzyme
MPAPILTDVARIMADVAATEVMPRWRNLASSDISEKTGPDDLVTVADRAAEKALTAELARLVPGSAVVGEEAVSVDPAVLGRLSGNGPVWVIDPIDGTQAFATGEPDFTLMVALVEAGKPAAGWIYAPALGTLAYGGAAHGVWLGDSARTLPQLFKPPIPPEVSAMTGLLGKRNISDARRAELQAKESHFRALEGVIFAGIDYMRILRGEAQFVLYSKSEPWDHLPGLALLAAFGFHAAKHDGTPYRPGDNTGGLLVAPDAASFATIRSLLLD